MAARVLIVSPVRNEALHIERVARAAAAQELMPTRWIVVDDRSDDDTLGIMRALEPELPFLTVARAPLLPADWNTKDRLALAAESRAFNAGLALDDWQSYTHVMKLDGDIELPPGYLNELIARMEADPSLGIAGGVLDEPVAGGRYRRLQIADTHVHGAVKLYTRECFAAIGGVQERLGWDSIDETYARMRGFRTQTFRDLVGIHHRPLGSADGTLRGHARHGACAYIAHQPATWVLLRSFRVGARRPVGLSGVAFLSGYARAGVLGVARVPDPEYRRFTRRELRRRMLGSLIRES